MDVDTERRKKNGQEIVTLKIQKQKGVNRSFCLQRTGLKIFMSEIERWVSRVEEENIATNGIFDILKIFK